MLFDRKILFNQFPWLKEKNRPMIISADYDGLSDVVSYNGNTYALGYYSENLALNTNCSATSNNLAR